MYGLCPHRYFPLAQGKLVGDNIQCGYHGFTFAPKGKCVLIPSQGTGSGFVQPVYRVVEKAPLIWIWMGDQALADPDQIVDYSEIGLSQAGWRNSDPLYFHLNGRSQLLVDNLMDLTHLAFIHPQIDGGAAIVNTKYIYEQKGATFRVTRPMDMPWTGFHDFLYGPAVRFEGISRVESVTDFYGPEFIRTGSPVTIAIEGYDAVPDGIGLVYFLHGITPETATTTHYFGLSTRNFRLTDNGLSQALLEIDILTREQDVVAINLVERRLQDAVARQQELLVKSDTAAVRVRGIIQGMLDKENLSNLSGEQGCGSIKASGPEVGD
jgi:vanillate O-demethylase monooxygenase subunit